MINHIICRNEESQHPCILSIILSQEHSTILFQLILKAICKAYITCLIHLHKFHNQLFDWHKIVLFLFFEENHYMSCIISYFNLHKSSIHLSNRHNTFLIQSVEEKSNKFYITVLKDLHRFYTHLFNQHNTIQFPLKNMINYIICMNEENLHRYILSIRLFREHSIFLFQLILKVSYKFCIILLINLHKFHNHLFYQRKIILFLFFEVNHYKSCII